MVADTKIDSASDIDDQHEKSSRRLRLGSKAAFKRLGVLFAVVCLLLLVAWLWLIEMPGRSHSGPLPAITDAQIATAHRFRADVAFLADSHPRRNIFNQLGYAASARYLEDRFREAGLEPTREVFSLSDGTTSCENVVAEIAAGPLDRGDVLVIGAHYDTIQGTPGADDNASGIACLLELAARFRARSKSDSLFPACTIRFVCFANEEPPHFMTEDMGSHVHAMVAKDLGEKIRLMVSLEMLGYYDDTPGSQSYPFPLSLFYPDTGDFVAVVGNISSAGHVRRLVGRWRKAQPFPCEGAALPSGIPGIGYSDHWSFWRAGYPAVMVTDTSFFRNPNYHTAADRPDTLDYERMARVVDALERVLGAEAE